MRKVAIVGAHVEQCSLDARDPNSLMLAACTNLLRSRQDKNKIGAVVCAGGGTYSGAILSECLGLRPRASHGVESMCCSGADALISGYAYVSSGLVDVALVAGADSAGPARALEWDSSRGSLKSPLYWGSLMTRAYKRATGATAEQIANIASKAHSSARANPAALLGRAHDPHSVLDSRQVTADLHLLECSRPASGGAALLLASQEMAGQSPAWIAGIGRATTGASFGTAGPLDRLESAQLAAAEAFQAANVDPNQVDVAELHDAFSALEAMAAEACGLYARGQGARALSDMRLTEEKRVNPRGGLVGSGHPFAATGLAQAAEIYFQLAGMAGKRQVPRARTGLAHTMAAAGTSSSVVVMCT